MTLKSEKMNKIILELAVKSTSLEGNPMKMASPNLRSLLAKLIISSDFSEYTKISLLEDLSIKMEFVNVNQFDYLSAVSSFISLGEKKMNMRELENIFYNKS